MISDADRRYIIEKYDYLKRVEDMCLALQKDLHDEKKKILKDFEKKDYNNSYVKITTNILDDGLLIKWTDLEKNGDLKIYRREGSFAHNAFSETDNGILVVDSHQREGEMIDYLEKQKDYYYTVNYKKWKARFFQGGPQTYHLNRFNVRLPEPKPEVQKSELDKHREILELRKEKGKIRRQLDVQEELERVLEEFDREDRLESIKALRTAQLIKKVGQGKPQREWGQEQWDEYERLSEDLDDRIYNIFDKG